MKKMKKMLALILALVMCVALVACGDSGPDKKAAIEAHNKAGDAVNALSDIINQDPDAYADYIDEMAELVDMLNECGDALGSSSVELTQEDLDEWAGLCAEIEQWAIDAKAEIGG